MGEKKEMEGMTESELLSILCRLEYGEDKKECRSCGKPLRVYSDDIDPINLNDARVSTDMEETIIGMVSVVLYCQGQCDHFVEIRMPSDTMDAENKPTEEKKEGE